MSTALPAVGTGILAALNNPVYPHRQYYTCTLTNQNSWAFICVKGRVGSVSMKESQWVDVCAYQPSSWQKKAVMKKLESQAVEFRDEQ